MALAAHVAAQPLFPYLEAGPWAIGPLLLHPFGVCAFFAAFLALYMYRRRAVEAQLEPKHIHTVLLWAFIPAVACSHIVYLITRHPDAHQRVLGLLNPFSGMSATGALLGTALGLIAYRWRYHVSFLRYADALVWGGAHGLLLFRIGCSFAHDHPGRFTPSQFSVRWPHATVDQLWNPDQWAGRHDLGLYEALGVAIVLAILWLTNHQGRRPPGFNLTVFLLMYGALRFSLGFFRAPENHLLALMQGNSAAVVILGLGIVLAVRQKIVGATGMAGRRAG